jgi:hypothetical protein
MIKHHGFNVPITKNNTYIETDMDVHQRWDLKRDGYYPDPEVVTVVTLHSTAIATIATRLKPDCFNMRTTFVRLNTGGWNTVTTKKRMNEIANWISTGDGRFYVYQNKFMLYAQKGQHSLANPPYEFKSQVPFYYTDRVTFALHTPEVSDAYNDLLDKFWIEWLHAQEAKEQIAS